MERDRTVERELTREEKANFRICITADHVRRKIPGCENLLSNYDLDLEGDWWTEIVPLDVIERMKKDLRHYVHRWLRRSTEQEILPVVDELNPSCKQVLYHLVRQQYKGLFAPGNQALPNRIVVPSLFSLLSSRSEKYMKIKQQYGLTTMTLEGVVPHARDAKVLIALSQIRKRKKLDDSYILSTTYGEMLRELGHRCQNEGLIRALQHSLTRLGGCILTIDHARGTKSEYWYAGTILHWAESRQNQLTVQLDKKFLEMYDTGYVRMPEREAFYKLSDKAGLIYLYLQRQKEFNQGGRLNPVNLYSLAGNSGLAPDPDLPKSQKRRHVIAALEQLSQSGFAGKLQYRITGDQIDITSKREK